MSAGNEPPAQAPANAAEEALFCVECRPPQKLLTEKEQAQLLGFLTSKLHETLKKKPKPGAKPAFTEYKTKAPAPTQGQPQAAAAGQGDQTPCGYRVRLYRKNGMICSVSEVLYCANDDCTSGSCVWEGVPFSEVCIAP